MKHLLKYGALSLSMAVATAFAQGGQTATAVLTLDGTWSLATDPTNVGREQKWFEKAQLEGAKSAKVPWIIQEAFPEYHGVVWYTREFDAPKNPHAGGRYLLRFWQVDYLADVWLNGAKVGGHEGGETPFVIDVTDAVKPGSKNLLVVRVLNPTQAPIDGIGLGATARRCKVPVFGAGSSFNHGGITDSVELLCVPEVYPADLFAAAVYDSKEGVIRVQTEVRNAAAAAKKGTLDITVSSARSGETTATLHLDRDLPPGVSQVKTELAVGTPHVWNLNDPYLYRVTVRVGTSGSAAFAEQSVRCGFRDFRFANGFFRLNGQRFYLKSTHTCNHFPIGQQFPRDPDMLRRDLLNLKVMGFNAVRFIWGGATRTQLDLCDEMGFLVYEESYASFPIEFSPQMPERFDTGVSELIRRDRNHPSVVIWGLLNETRDSPVFQHAVAMLPLVRALDPDRMVLLNSGRWDVYLSPSVRGTIGDFACFKMWAIRAAAEPWVAVNASADTVRTLGITWPSNHLALHPGPENQFSVVRWTAPEAGEVEVAGKFVGLSEKATTDVHVLHNGKPLFDGLLNLSGSPNEAPFSKKVTVAQGDTIDGVVGVGNGSYGADTTGLVLALKTANKTYDATADFSEKTNPNGAWSYGWMPSAAGPAAAAFTPYADDKTHDVKPAALAAGTLSNPGSAVWENSVGDYHCYPRVPHSQGDIQSLRTRDGGGGKPLFLSEYGIGSAVDLWRAARHYEQEGAEKLEDAKYLKDKLDRFLNDWQQWRMDEVFARPEDFFMESLKKMAGQRTLGLNAIRSNPRIVAYSLTGGTDHVFCGEGLTTLFRELKPGTIDAMFDAWYPLRWCLFAEPAHLARGGKVHLEATLADEDTLAPGEYPARLQVIGPHLARVMDKTITVTVPNRDAAASEQPFAKLWFSADVAIDGPSGEYRFLATFERGAAASGGQTTFYVSDPAEWPAVATEVVLWGDDPELTQWLAAHGVHTRPFAADAAGKREVILVSSKPAAPGGAAAFRELAKHIASGSSAVFLSPDVFARAEQPTAWLPLARKGTVTRIYGWLYLKDEWAKSHPIFEGLQAGGLMDYAFYGDLIPDALYAGQEPPAEAVAGANKASQGYDAGLMVSAYALGQGRFILNTLRIRETLASNPVAGRLLLNLLRYAGKDAALPTAPLPADFEQQLDALGYK